MATQVDQRSQRGYEVGAVDLGNDAQVAVARDLVREYQRWLNVDLCFQDFEAEMAAFPGECVPPRGVVLLARHYGANEGDECVGVGCLRPLRTAAEAELKRIYVRESHRGHGLGRRLTESALEVARRAGYARVRLDTLPHLDSAITLYRSMGFRETKPYYHNPLPGVRYMALELLELQD